jgi:hypothetical protein
VSFFLYIYAFLILTNLLLDVIYENATERDGKGRRMTKTGQEGLETRMSRALVRFFFYIFLFLVLTNAT